MESLPKVLKAMRIISNIKQSVFAKMIGINATYLSKIENGKRKMSNMDTLEKYSNVFRVPCSSILFAAEEMDKIKDAGHLVKLHIVGKLLNRELRVSG